MSQRTIEQYDPTSNRHYMDLQEYLSHDGIPGHAYSEDLTNESPPIQIPEGAFVLPEISVGPAE